MTLDDIRSTLRKAIVSEYGEQPLEPMMIDTPPDIALGDFSFGCFALSRSVRRSPADIASALATSLAGEELFSAVSAAGPYLNLTLANREFFAGPDAKPDGEKPAETIMVEYLSPNTNKPLHLGHVRNGCLGTSIANLLEYVIGPVIRANLINDRGVHIMKSMLAWQRWADGATPETAGEKGDHFVGRWYVRFAVESEKDAALKDEAQAMLTRWEQGDPETIALWERMNGWVYDGFDATYELFGFRFDRIDHESKTYELGKDLVLKGVEKGVFEHNTEGAVTFALPAEFGAEEDGSPKRLTLLRQDGTSVYITQDIGTAVMRFEAHGLESLIYVVGSEQRYHFRCLVAVLKALKYAWADGIKHLAYGMVYLPDGKMKSREGKVVDADNLANEVIALARTAIKEKHASEALSDTEVDRRARAIAIGAIKFEMLKVGADQDIHFDPRASIAFDGMTGPYCQYAYARIMSILRRRGDLPDSYDPSLLGGNNEERLLGRLLLTFDRAATDAAAALDPSGFVRHIYELAQAVSQFYHKHPVLGGDDETLAIARLHLLSTVADRLKTGLALLGIDALEQM